MVLGFVRVGITVQDNLTDAERIYGLERKVISCEDENIKLKSYISELT